MKIAPLSLIALIALLSACSSVYMPNVPNTPMLSAQGEFNAGAHLSLKGNLNLNAAYAVSDHIGVIASGSTIGNKRSKKEFDNQLLEFGIGFIDRFGEDKSRIFEVYGGVGKGSTYITHKAVVDQKLIPVEIQDVKFNKSFLQVNYSSKEKNTWHLFGEQFPISYGTAIRISYIEMKNFYLNHIDQPKEDNIFIEPVFFTQMSLSDKFKLQYTSSTNFGLKSRKYLTAGNSIFTLGLIFQIKPKD